MMTDTFRVIVAGSRNFTDYDLLKSKLDFLLKNKTNAVIISGCAKGADKLGERYAKERGYKIAEYPADWSLGKKAGYLRNKQMAENADAAVIFWDGESPGSKHMIDLAKERKLLVRVIKF